MRVETADYNRIDFEKFRTHVLPCSELRLDFRIRSDQPVTYREFLLLREVPADRRIPLKLAKEYKLSVVREQEHTLPKTRNLSLPHYIPISLYACRVGK